MEISRILIGIDNSRYAEHAAAYGFGLARKFNAAVGLITVIEPVPTTGSSMNDTTFGMPFDSTADLVNVEMVNAQNDAADTILKATIQKFGSDMQVTQYTDYGSSGDGIINCAAQFNADLIVIGTHHRSGIDRLLMGSVAETVVRNATVPVLVVPMQEEEA